MQMHRIGEDVAEALDRVPARLRVVRTIRPKYACRACEVTYRPGKSAGAAHRGRHGDDGADRAYRRGAPGSRRSIFTVS
jgi:transposase